MMKNFPNFCFCARLVLGCRQGPVKGNRISNTHFYDNLLNCVMYKIQKFWIKTSNIHCSEQCKQVKRKAHHLRSFFGVIFGGLKHFASWSSLSRHSRRFRTCQTVRLATRYAAMISIQRSGFPNSEIEPFYYFHENEKAFFSKPLKSCSLSNEIINFYN